MSLSVEIQATAPLFRKLRDGLLWHCTKLSNYRQIVASGSILPFLPQQQNRWGSRPYACQTLSAVCLFDFSSASEALVLQTADRWRPFLLLDSPLTVLVGMNQQRLPGELVPYPKNRDATPKDSCGPIPFVEVCHVGPIPVSAIAMHILVCAANLNEFRCIDVLTDSVLEEAIREFRELVQAAKEKRATELAAFRSDPQNQELRKSIQEARDRVAAMRNLA